MTKKDKWCNQTQLGFAFNLSAIKVGKELVNIDLKDMTTGEPTQKSFDQGLAMG